jgi:ABC-type cobalt transport system substrate-binding protein
MKLSKNYKLLLVFIIFLILSICFFIFNKSNFTQNDKNQTILDNIKYLADNKPQFPSILPSSTELSQKLFSSNLAILCMYFIQVIVYLYKQDTNKLKYPIINNNDILSFINTFLPTNAKAVKLLTYTCEKDLNTYYGGFIIEYILNSKITSFIVFRGTQESCEWGEDSKEQLINPEWLSNYSNVKVHNGFNNIYTNKKIIFNLRQQIWNYINKNTFSNLVVTGHSLGGGLCYLFAADISANRPELRNNTKIFSFAGPYAGNKEFVDLILSVDSTPIYSGIFSIINTQDPVPNTKLPFHENIPIQKFCFTSYGNGIKGSVHFPETYMKGLIDNTNIFNSNASSKASCGSSCEKK